ncbi:MAG: hypothetical protein LAT57_00040 [Balneolales bacterium]|nr:hypothetical protein [Balneolales bacterium]
MNHLKKAQHNEKVCRHLDIDGDEFVDWIAITAYYAAYHYLLSVLFPGTFKLSNRDIDFKSFEDFKGSSIVRTNVKGSHQVLLYAVKSNLNKAYYSHKRLLDKCNEYRYKTFYPNDPKVEKERIMVELMSVKGNCGISI